MNVNEYPPEEITQLHIWCGGKSGARHGFWFKLSNYYGAGNITFDCECYTEDKTMIHLGGIPVDFIYMEKVREIAAKHNFIKMNPRDIKNYKHDPEKAQAAMDISWAGGVKEFKELRTDYWPDAGVDELLELFWGLVNLFMGGGGKQKLPMRAEDITRLSYGGRELPRYGRYELREHNDGKIMLSWPSMGGKTGWEIYSNTVKVDYMYMDRLREIVKYYGILEPKPEILKSLPPDEHLYRHREEIKPPHLEVHWKPVSLSHNQFNWDRRSWLRLSKPTNGGEALLEFFRKLAINNAKIAKTKFSHYSGPTK